MQLRLTKFVEKKKLFDFMSHLDKGNSSVLFSQKNRVKKIPQNRVLN